MPTLPTLPKKPWPYYATLMLAAAALALGFALLLNELTVLDLMVLSHPVEYPSWQYAVAAGTVLLALTVLLLQFTDWPWLAWLALGTAVMAITELVPALLGPHSGLETWLVKFLDTKQLPIHAEMPLIVAVALLIAALAVTWLAFPLWRAACGRVLALAGSLLAAIGIATFTAHAFNLTESNRWDTVDSMSPGASVLLIILGAMLIMLALREHRRTQEGTPIWLPLPFVAGSAAITFVFWAGLHAQELRIIEERSIVVINSIYTAFVAEAKHQTDMVEHLAQHWSTNGVPPENSRMDDYTLLYSEVPSLAALVWVTPDLNTDWFYPTNYNDGLIGFNQGDVPERKRAFVNILSNSPVLIPLLQRPNLDKRFALVAPVQRNDSLAGWVMAENSYDHFFSDLEQRLRISQNFRYEIYLGSQLIYESGEDSGLTEEQMASTLTYNVQKINFSIRVAPTRNYLARDRSALPGLVLGTGLGITLLLGLSVHLASATFTALRATRLTNRQLMLQDEERRLVAAQLKTSDERLNLALDSTAIGIFEWDIPRNEIHGNPGLWSLLGLSPALPSTLPALWEAHVHPDDLAGYRATRDAQLIGAETFTDAAYRMQTPGGSWRWLSVRAKTVGTAGGRPIRIVGTVQDITARKQAEIALGVSQTAARKLSLVASKTDNLVIIAKPDGTIEWVNESFTRVMEYSLEEIIGRNPAHFMIGPETSYRTMHRIRMALKQGEGISTDIVNYAKSGRKYHLQLEIQPVRNEQGLLENFIAIEADITTRIETETALRRAKTEADTASRAKSEFLASLSHEIRTPMNGVIGMTSLLLDTPLNPDQRDFVSTIRSSGESLLAIINDILDFSKIESGKFEIDHQPFDLATCLEEALDLFSAQAAARKLELAHAIAANVPELIIGDGARLRQVISNLVNNAIKFTPAGRVTVEARLLPAETNVPFGPAGPAGRARLQVVVRDTGIGIPPDRLNRLFRPFSQVDSSTTRKYGGTGLGLAICQRLCSLMGGSIRVESLPGQGSAFIFIIAIELLPDRRQPPPRELPPPLTPGARVLCYDDNPVALRWLTVFFERSGLAVLPVTTPEAAVTALRAPDAPVLAVLDVISPAADEPIQQALAARPVHVLTLLPAGATLPPPAPKCLALAKPLRTLAFNCALQTLYQIAPGAAPTPAPTPQRLLAEEIPLNVLLVEDNPVNQKVGVRFLERLGYRADVANNGREALDAIAEKSYDFILMDIQMPVMDGYDATREIRRIQDPAHAPRIVALTANALQSDRDQSTAVGMDGFITKPVKLPEIAATIRRLFPPASR